MKGTKAILSLTKISCHFWCESRLKSDEIRSDFRG